MGFRALVVLVWLDCRCVCGTVIQGVLRVFMSL